MAPQPEQQARGNIDRLLQAAGWHVCDADADNIHATHCMFIRECPLPFAYLSTGVGKRSTYGFEATGSPRTASIKGIDF